MKTQTKTQIQFNRAGGKTTLLITFPLQCANPTNWKLGAPLVEMRTTFDQQYDALEYCMKLFTFDAETVYGLINIRGAGPTRFSLGFNDLWAPTMDYFPIETQSNELTLEDIVKCKRYLLDALIELDLSVVNKAVLEPIQKTQGGIWKQLKESIPSDFTIQTWNAYQLRRKAGQLALELGAVVQPFVADDLKLTVVHPTGLAVVVHNTGIVSVNIDDSGSAAFALRKDFLFEATLKANDQAQDLMHKAAADHGRVSKEFKAAEQNFEQASKRFKVIAENYEY